MMPDSPENKPQLPGYELLDKLGAGGYGEVWSARVPGGMTKAVKLIFGLQDEQRAANELKSLERIREVRHPFIVSLERVEFLDGRVVVVSELADGSLRDRFRECAAQGLPGIPRDELLGYLKEVADALDFLTQKHSLQHLDIKPENVLLLAGHAKVADFGLVKSIGDKTQSLVGGMTPAYAPPEVFQGLPSQQSDQYSLAVMYQEMLTGLLPFAGDNAAELTLQHLHDDPDLTALGEEDHFAVSRALSKNPENRYESCGEFVAALQGQDSFSARRSPAATPKRAAPTREQVTEVFGDEPMTQTPSRMRIDLPPLEETELAHLPPPAEVVEQESYSPALFIGIGGTAAVVLRELRQRLSERFEIAEPLPTMPMLLLDTDQKSLMVAGRNASRGAGLTPEELISLPLRRPQEYRDKSDGLLRWLGRRWLYNIPKSLQTEGIRPLGRLALIDHARQAFQRIRRAMAECTTPEALDAAQELTNLSFQPDALRVYVVASTSGGTGSGISLDVAYAVRTLLQKLGIENAQVIGVMTTSTGRDAERGELARVNSFSWISEHQHFSNPAHAYEGDASCGLPGHKPEVPPFDTAYLVNLGNRLDPGAFAGACRSVADYLYLDAATPAHALLSACRDSDAAPHTLRSFAVERLEAAPTHEREETEQAVVNLLLNCWVGETDNTAKQDADARTTDRIVVGAGELVGQLKLDSINLATFSRGLIEEHLKSTTLPAVTGHTPVERLESLKQRFLADPARGAALLGEHTPRAVCGLDAADASALLLTEHSQSVTKWVAERLDKPGVRLDGAVRAAAWFRNHAETLLKDLHRFAEATRKKLGEVVQTAAAATEPTAELEDRYSRLQVDLVALECAAQVAAGLRGVVAQETERLMLHKPLIKKLQQTLKSDAGELSAELRASLADRGVSLTRLMQTADARVQQDWLDERGGLDLALQEQGARKDLAGAIRRTIQQVVREALLGTGHTSTPATTASEWPRLGFSDLGGAAYAAALTTTTDQPPLGPEGQTAWACASCDGDGYLLLEAQGLSAPHLAVSIVAARRDYAEFAERVHARRDIAWGNLLQAANNAPLCVNHTHACTMPIQPSDSIV